MQSREGTQRTLPQAAAHLWGGESKQAKISAPEQSGGFQEGLGSAGLETCPSGLDTDVLEDFLVLVGEGQEPPWNM